MLPSPWMAARCISLILCVPLRCAVLPCIRTERLYDKFLERYFMTKVINVIPGPEGDEAGDEGEEALVIRRNGKSAQPAAATSSGSRSSGSDGAANASAGKANDDDSSSTSSGSGSGSGSDEEAASGDEDEGAAEAEAQRDGLEAYAKVRREVMAAMKRDLGFIMRWVPRAATGGLTCLKYGACVSTKEGSTCLRACVYVMPLPPTNTYRQVQGLRVAGHTAGHHRGLGARRAGAAVAARRALVLHRAHGKPG